MRAVSIRFWRYVFLTPVLGAVGVGILWALGLASFIITVLVMTPQQLTEKTDGIVILTGGADRVTTGLTLFNNGQARALLISGVHPTTRLGDIAATAGIRNALPCCITLGFHAQDTVGNATETADWVSKNNIKTLRIVTASYHIPRAAIEMRRVMPNTLFVLHPVHTNRFQIFSSAGLRLVFVEYHKSLLSLGRLLVDWWRDNPQPNVPS